MGYVIGVDAGGTKTTASAYDNVTGYELGTVVGGFGNVTVDYVQGMRNIVSAIDELIAKMEGKKPYFICLGSAGIETGDKKQKAHDLLVQKYGDIVFVTNDAMLGLYSALEGNDGVLVIAGTGSIGYLKKGKELHRFGGWGHLINDDGSGYSIALKAIRKITYSFDTRNPETPLKKAVFSELKIDSLRELIDFTYRSDKGEIAALTPVVSKLAEEGDEEAKEILEWAGESLSVLCTGLCSQYDIGRPKIALSGSVIKKIPIVKETFIKKIGGKIADFEIYDGDFNPAKAAYYIYKGNNENANRRTY